MSLGELNTELLYDCGNRTPGTFLQPWLQPWLQLASCARYVLQLVQINTRHVRTLLKSINGVSMAANVNTHWESSQNVRNHYSIHNIASMVSFGM